jgi:cation:H+ antiporter
VIWFEFAVCLGIVLFAGTKLAQYGDIIAEKTGLGRIWIGVVLIAFVTTIPELVTSVSSVALVHSPDLALGTLLGSCCFNLAILAILDILHRRTPVLSLASPRHIAAGSWGAALIAIAGVGILVGRRFSFLTVGWVGVPTIVILVVYLLGMWSIFRRERGMQFKDLPGAAQYEKFTAKWVGIRFALAAAAVIGAGIWLSIIGDDIGKATGWGSTFIGSMFLAIATSAPELVVSITALRIGAVDLAVADILGANMLDIAMILPVDLAQRSGFVLAAVSDGQLIVAAVAVAMTLVVMIGLRLGRERKLFRVISWYTPLLIALYVYGSYALFNSGSGL